MKKVKGSVTPKLNIFVSFPFKKEDKKSLRDPPPLHLTMTKKTWILQKKKSKEKCIIFIPFLQPLIAFSCSKAVLITLSLILSWSSSLLYSPVCSSHLQLFGRHRGTAECSDIFVYNSPSVDDCNRRRNTLFFLRTVFHLLLFNNELDCFS